VGTQPALFGNRFGADAFSAHGLPPSPGGRLGMAPASLPATPRIGSVWPVAGS
jgi:hypothetical protein